MANQQTVKGAEAILLSLLAEGVDTIFGYPGGQVIPLYNHIYDYTDKLHHILARHEQGAVHSAQGYARATGKVGVCIATSGPGATNLVTGIADAMLDSTPLVCITGQVPANLLGTDAFQEADTISMTMPITKWNFQVTSACEIPAAIAKAFYIASSGRPGPVVIDIAKNAQVEDCNFEYTPCTSLRSYKATPELDLIQMDAVASMINSSQRPLIIVGQGVKLSGGESELIEFAQNGNIPMGTTLMGISTVPSNHPLFMGNLGMHGNLAPNDMTQEADLIIAIGMRFSDRITGDISKYAPKAKIIHIDIDAAEINKNVKVEVGVVANAKQALEALKDLVTFVERKEWFEFGKARQMHEKENLTDKCLAPSPDYITMAQTISTLADVEKGEAIIVTDVGQNQMFGALYSRFNHTRSFITSGGLGTMGFGLPAAIGAKLGAPEREVVALLGDGGFQMTMQELGTIMQDKIGVKVIVLNNSYLGMVRQWQQLFFDRRYSFTQLDNPDITKIAEAYNIASERVSDPKELRAALERMRDCKDAYLLEVVILPEENVFPMVPAGASLSNILLEE
ncbi:MAG: biosynthetic-type acetolactate synthase large subunit [Rikenellaceae bacterium]